MPNALITGASRGIGRAIAVRLAADGYKVIINYRQNAKAAEQVCRQIQQNGGSALPLPADVSQPEAVAQLFEQIQTQLGGVDVLVNNAGIAHFGLISDLTLAEWRRIFAVNVDGAFNCIQAAIPHMIHQKKGVIINIASIWGLVGASCEAAYSASKGALIALTKALAKELGPSQIRVNCVAPGVIDTEMNSRLNPDEIAALKDETPLGCLGRPEDVAAAVSWLTSPQAQFITGQIISPNGGFTIY